MNPAAPAVRVRALQKTYRGQRRGRAWLTPWRKPEGVTALQDVSLDVARGELVALVGPNGAGKTTLLEVLADLVRPDAGTLEILGEPPSRARVGYVLAEERSFFLRLSVRANLSFFATLEGLHGVAARERIEHLAELLGLRPLLGRRFAELSRGQKQRVGIARGLLSDPPVLLFDEATRALDPGRARGFRRLVREVLVERHEKAVLFATHQLDEVSELADRVALLVKGELVSLGPWLQVRASAEAAFAQEAVEEDAALTELLDVEAKR